MADNDDGLYKHNIWTLMRANCNQIMDKKLEDIGQKLEELCNIRVRAFDIMEYDVKKFKDTKDFQLKSLDDLSNRMDFVEDEPTAIAEVLEKVGA